MYSTSTNAWNEGAGFDSFPVVIATDAGITGLTAASIALAPTYLGSDDAECIAFVGLTIAGSSAAVAKTATPTTMITDRTETASGSGAGG